MVQRFRLVPATLFGQTVLILLAGLAISAALGYSILAYNQVAVVRAMGAFDVTQRIVSVTRLLDDAPAAWRGRLIKAASGETLRITTSPYRPVWAALQAKGADARTIRAYLATQLPPNIEASLSVSVETVPSLMSRRQKNMMAMMDRHSPRDMAMMAGMTPWHRMRAAIRLPDGAWMIFAAALPSSGFGLSWPLLAAFLGMTIVVIAASVWAVRRVTAPLGAMAEAADRLGRDVGAPPLAEIGTLETRQAAHAFNLMQTRLRQLVESRTRMLAALSHDLRTPLTLLQLRIEDVKDDEERERMLTTIASMNEMIEATLAFARDDTMVEPRRRIDLTALLAAIVNDLADAGRSVTMAPAAPVTIACQPVALRRALVNLLDNAIKYGGSADVAVTPHRHRVAVTIDDHGPGIPDAELGKVFEPFYRLETSRSRETGGSGLGLAIALAIIEAHGGKLELSNRSGGGLSANVTLTW
ncbi:MAG: ATP-binding protein [Acidiphilium sp.]|nr:ATP-binding protein [Acidiphilium sp.]MDD4936923.1 ATP-binding protein [Acidiphilium sp.]